MHANVTEKNKRVKLQRCCWGHMSCERIPKMEMSSANFVLISPPPPRHWPLIGVRLVCKWVDSPKLLALLFRSVFQGQKALVEASACAKQGALKRKLAGEDMIGGRAWGWISEGCRMKPIKRDPLDLIILNKWGKPKCLRFKNSPKTYPENINTLTHFNERLNVLLGSDLEKVSLSRRFL